MRPIMLALQACKGKDNLIFSAILELIDFARIESIRIIIQDIVENYSSCFDDVKVPVLQNLRLKYDQGNDNSMNYFGEKSKDSSSDGGGGASMKSVTSMNRNRMFSERDREEAYFFDDQDDDTDTNVITQTTEDPLKLLSMYKDDDDDKEKIDFPKVPSPVSRLVDVDGIGNVVILILIPILNTNTNTNNYRFDDQYTEFK